MERIPKDVMELITDKLSPQDFVTYCSSDVNRKFCDRQEIWRRRIEKDYGFLLALKKFKNYKNDPKKTYLDLSKKIFTTVENATDDVLKIFGKHLLKYLGDYKKALHKFLYDHIISNLKHIIRTENVSDLTKEELSDVYFGGGNYGELFNILPSLLDSDSFSDYFSDKLGNRIEDLLIDIIYEDLLSMEKALPTIQTIPRLPVMYIPPGGRL